MDTIKIFGIREINNFITVLKKTQHNYIDHPIQIMIGNSIYSIVIETFDDT